MRRAVFAFIVLVMGCSGSETTGPAGPLPLNSVVVEAPDTLVIGRTVQLKVILRDASNNEVLDRPVTFITGNARIASVDASGVVTALAEGQVTITAISEGKSGLTTLTIIHPIRLCAINSGLDQCVGAETYTLVLVNDQRLPVESPWGGGGNWDDWDFETWFLTDETITLFAAGDFLHTVTQRSASGLTSSGAFIGRYERTADAVVFRPSPSALPATISGNRLIVEWFDGRKFTYQR